MSLLLTGCASDLTVQVLKQKYPACDVLKVEDDVGDYQKVTLQCPPAMIKVVRIKKVN